MQGTTLKLVVAHWPPLFGVGRKDGIQTLPSQDEYHVLRPGDTYGWLKDLLVIMAKDLNFTFRLVRGPKSGTLRRYANDLFYSFFSRQDEAWALCLCLLLTPRQKSFGLIIDLQATSSC